MNGEPHARLCGMLELCRAAARRSALIRSESIEGRLYGAGFNPGVSSGQPPNLALQRTVQQRRFAPLLAGR